MAIEVNYGDPLNYGLVAWYPMDTIYPGGLRNAIRGGVHATGVDFADNSAWLNGKAPSGFGSVVLDDDYFNLTNLNTGTTFADQEATFAIWVKRFEDHPSVTRGSWAFNNANASNHYPHPNGNIYDGTFKTGRETVGVGLVDDMTQWHQVVIRRRAGTDGWGFFQNGENYVNRSGQTWQMNATPYIGHSTSGYLLDASISDIRVYNRWLDDTEIRQLYKATRLHYPTQIRRSVVRGFSPGISITAETGAFTLTGNDAAFKTTGVTSAGTFTEVGQDAGFKTKLACDTGSFALTGNDADFAIATKLVADAGSFALTGNDQANKITMVCETGAFTYTGNDATLTLNEADSITASTGTFALTAQDAGFKTTMVCDTGSFTATAQDATFKLTAAMATGTFVYSGRVSLFKVRLSSEAGSIVLSGGTLTTPVTASPYYYPLLASD